MSLSACPRDFGLRRSRDNLPAFHLGILLRIVPHHDVSCLFGSCIVDIRYCKPEATVINGKMRMEKTICCAILVCLGASGYEGGTGFVWALSYCVKIKQSTHPGGAGPSTLRWYSSGNLPSSVVANSKHWALSSKVLHLPLSTETTFRVLVVLEVVVSAVDVVFARPFVPATIDGSSSA